MTFCMASQLSLSARIVYQRAFTLFVCMAMVPVLSFSQNAPANVGSDGNAAITLAQSKSGVIVTSADVLSELQRAPEANRNAALANPETVQQIVNSLLIRRELAHEAMSAKLSEDALVAATLAIARDRVLSDAQLVKIDLQNAPSVAALDAYAKAKYAATSEKYDRPAQTHARHILIANTGPEARVKAQDLLAQLRSGASFEDLAKTNSSDRSSAERGGDLGYFAAGKMVPPFDEEVAKLTKVGEISDVVESQFGYHIIRLEGRRDKGRIPYEEVRQKLVDDARTTLLNEARIKRVEIMKQNFEFLSEAIAKFSKSAPSQ